MDFTLRIYISLLKTLRNQGFKFLPVEDTLQVLQPKSIILRHDVDLLPCNSLQFARIQSDFGIRGTYYFRIVPNSFDERIIKKISSFGHEIGYHYEDIDLVVKSLRAQGSGLRGEKKSEKELAELAIDSFSKNLKRIQQLAPIKTICMHGSPLSSWDNRLLWKYYDYREFGLALEPYFDIDFTNIGYLTDTGRRWDGSNVSLRDKAFVLDSKDSEGDKYADWTVIPKAGSLMNMTPQGIVFQNRYRYHSTSSIISAIENDRFPDNAVITIHPQRWTDRPHLWVRELVCQNVKNIVKYILLTDRHVGH